MDENTTPLTDQEVLALEVQMRFDNINKQLKQLQRKVDASFDQIKKSRKVGRAGTALSGTFKDAAHDTDDYLEEITRKIRQETEKAEKVVKKSALTMRTELENAFDNINLKMDSDLSGINKIGGASASISGMGEKIDEIGDKIGKVKSGITTGLGSSLGGVLGGLISADAIGRAASKLGDVKQTLGGTLTFTQKVNETFKNVEKILGTLTGQFDAILNILERIDKVQLSSAVQNYARYVHTAKKQVEGLSKAQGVLRNEVEKAKDDVLKFYNSINQYEGLPTYSSFSEVFSQDIDQYLEMMESLNDQLRDNDVLRDYIHKLEIMKNTLNNIKKLAASGVFDGIEQGSLAHYMDDMEKTLTEAEKTMSKLLDTRPQNGKGPFDYFIQSAKALDDELDNLSKQSIKVGNIDSSSINKVIEEIKNKVNASINGAEIRFGKDLFNDAEVNDTINNLIKKLHELDNTEINTTVNADTAGATKNILDWVGGIADQIEPIVARMVDEIHNELDGDVFDELSDSDIQAKIKEKFKQWFNIDVDEFLDPVRFGIESTRKEILDRIVDATRQINDAMTNNIEGLAFNQNFQPELDHLAEFYDRIKNINLNPNADASEIEDLINKLQQALEYIDDLENMGTIRADLNNTGLDSGPYLFPDLTDFLRNVKDVAQGYAEVFRERTSEITNDVNGRFKEAFEKIKLFFKNASYDTLGLLSFSPDEVDSGVEKLKSTFGNVFESIKSKWRSVLDEFEKINGLSLDFDNLVDLNTLDGGEMYSKLELALGKVLEKAREAWNTISTTAQEAANKVKEVWDNATSKVSEAWEKVANTRAGKAITAIGKRCGAVANNCFSYFIRAIRRITPWFTKLRDKFRKSAKDIGDDAEEAGNRIESAMDKASNGITGLIKKLLPIAAIIAGLKAAISLGIEAIQLEGQISNLYRQMGAYVDDQTGEVIFNGDQYLEWAEKVSSAYGISTKAALDYGNTFASMFRNFAGNDIATYTQDFLKQAALIAQGTGRTMDDVLDRLRSGMLGSTEAIEDLGVYVSESTMKSLLKNKEFIVDSET